jgi:hypothetical protein
MDFVFGLIVVIWLATRRFNTPRPVRTYTKPAHYFCGSAAYVALALLVYLCSYSLLAGAVVLLGGAVRLPGTSRADRWIRGRLQLAIGYPTEARCLAAALAVAPFVPGAKVRDEVRVVLQGRGYDIDDDWLPAAEPIRELWFRVAALFQQVRRWERDSRFGGFVWQARDEFDVLCQRFDQLSLKVVRVLETIEQLGRLWVCASGDSGPSARVPQHAAEAQQRAHLRAIISRMLADLRQDLAFFNQNLCLLVARGVLTECLSARGRHRQLAKLGFKVAPEGPSTTRVLALTFLFLLAVFLVFGTVWSGKAPGLSEDLPRITKIALIQVLAVAVAVVPKPLFGFANENLRGQTPWGYVLGAGLAAALLALPLQLAFYVWFKGGSLSDVVAMANGVRGMFSWLLMPFTMAASLAFLIQDGRWARIDSPFRRRLADVLFLVGALGLGLCAARGLQYLLTGRVWSYDAAVRNAWLITFIAVGIGYMIPHMFRHPLRLTAGRPPAGVPTSLAQGAPTRAPLAAQA